MDFYQATDKKGVNYFIESATPITGSTAADEKVSGDNSIGPFRLAVKHDFSLVDNTLTKQYRIMSMDGWTYYGTALSGTDFITKWTAAFPLKTFYSCEPVSNNKFIFAQNAYIRMLNVHFGQSNADYSSSQITPVIAKAVQGQYNYFRDNYSTLDDTMAYATGSRLPASMAAAKLAGINYSLVLSITGGTGTLPATLDSNWTASISKSTSWTKAEVKAIFDRFVTRGRNAQTRNPDVNIWGIGSETENLDANIKIKSTSVGGVKEPPAPVFDSVKGMDVYTSNIDYNARAYPAAIAAIAGYDIGIKQINPKAKTYCNASYLHYGQIALLMKEAKRLYGANINWFGQDAYNSEEYGNDPTGYFNGGKGTTSSRGQWVQKPYKYFVETGICEGVGLIETGWNTAKGNPDGITQTQWFDILRTQYHADPRCLFIGEYEAINEPISRASSPDSAERTYGITDTTLAAMATWQYNPKPPLINPYI